MDFSPSDASETAKIIRVNVERGEAGLFYATSPNLRGLLVAAATMEELEKSIPLAISDLSRACGQSVMVFPADDFDGGNGLVKSWVKLPTALARQLETA